LAKIDIFSLGQAGLREFVASLGMKPFRADQIIRWVYVSGKDSFSEMTDISKEGRALLEERAEIKYLDILDRRISADGTEKYLFGLPDGEKIESVLIPDENRVTLCISSQAGCALGCSFCLTGGGGFRRNLLPHEIVGQPLAVQRLHPERPITNFVLMGMGEPLNNTANVIEALRRMTADKMLGVSTRKITLSTAGVVPGLRELAESGVGVNLAVSLNAPNDKVRDELMPINRVYPLSELVRALKAFPLAPRRKITVEYVMLKGVNDSVRDAEEVAKLLRGIKCKVNLIPFNEHPGSKYKRPDTRAVIAFQGALGLRNYTTFIRESRGSDILAACGQLRADGRKKA
jgi:23S rRNA (adenine2503-C2)-methyltransferase